MFDFLRSCLKFPPRSVPWRPRACRPAVETLEGRTLLDASGFVKGLYADILHRPNPSQGEVDGWVNAIRSGVRKEDVVHAFVESNEHRAHFVSDDYVRLLGRPAEGA